MVGVLVLPAILENAGYKLSTQIWAMALFAVLTLIPAVALCAGVVPEPPVKLKTHAPLIPTLKFLFKNDALRRVIAVDLIASTNGGAIGAMFFFFARYALGLPEWAGTLLLVYFVTGCICIPFWIWLSRRIGKHKALVISFVYSLVTMPLFLLIPKGSLAVALPVRFSVVQANPPGQGCDLYVMDVNQGRYAFKVLGDQSTGSVYGTREGVIPGKIDDPKPERVLGFQQTAGLTRHWWVSADWLGELFHTNTVRSWSSDTPTTVYDPAQDPQHLPGQIKAMRGNDVFIEVGQGVDDQYETTAIYGEMVWTPSAGLVQLLRWPSDPARNAANFGTDGEDMVWIYQGHSAKSVMTAKYSADPAVVAQSERRLAADPAAVFPLPHPFVVGCGYAARNLWTAADQTMDLFIVRLSDGTAWRLHGGAASEAFNYDIALGITCSDIFVQAEMPDDPTAILRIPLVNLGTPLPPS